MHAPERVAWFAGDLSDPWVGAIADALPNPLRIDCPAELPDAWPVARRSPSAVVVHRSTLTPVDAQRLARLRARWEPSPRLILCVGPHARYADVERWSRLVDAVLPEATAPETVARHVRLVDRPTRPPGARPRVAVVSPNFELRSALADACRAAGFAAEAAVDWDDLPVGMVVAWDVPILEPGWPGRLAGRARTSPVVALLGFADRATVALAREHGASACLDLPCELDDLVCIFDRVTSAHLHPAHDVPSPPMGRKAVQARKG